MEPALGAGLDHSARASGEDTGIDGLLSSRFTRFMASVTGSDRATVIDATPLRGGMNHAVWHAALSLQKHGKAELRNFVVRRESARHRSGRLNLRQEMAVMAAVRRAGLPVPEPVAYCDDPEILGAPFGALSWEPGVTQPLQARTQVRSEHEAAELLHELGGILARLHAIPTTQPELRSLDSRPPQAIRRQGLRSVAAASEAAFPQLAQGLRWLKGHMPARYAPVVTHGDFGPGNILFCERRPTAILDWELAGINDRHSDLASFWAKGWRRGLWIAREADPALRGRLVDGYLAAGGADIDDATLRWWEVLSHVRYSAAIIAMISRQPGLAEKLELALHSVGATERIAILAKGPPTGC